jgi:apolipoprotein N-acyltransferase
MVLTLPWFGVWPLAWVALVPFISFLFSPANSIRKAVFGSVIFGTLYSVVSVWPLFHVNGMWWVSSSNEIVSQQVIYGLIAVLVACIGGLTYAPLGLASYFLRSKPYGGALWAIVWAVLEWARVSFLVFGFSWGALGYTLSRTQDIKALALFGGVYALTFLVVLGNVAVFKLIASFSSEEEQRDEATAIGDSSIESQRGRAMRGLDILIFLALISALFLVGVFRDQAPDACAQRSLRVAVIGVNMSKEETVREGGYRKMRERLLEALASDPDVVLLPENAFPYFELELPELSFHRNGLIQLENKRELYEDLVGISREHPDTEIVIGMHIVDGTKRYNAMIAYRFGHPRFIYAKRSLIPLAEYVPDPLDVPLVVRFVPGEQEGVVSVAGVSVAGYICSEITDTRLSTRGADLVLSPSNDGIFVGGASAALHRDMAILRAIEAGAYLLRSVNSGTSSIIDPRGREIAVTTDGVIYATIPVCGPSEGD